MGREIIFMGLLGAIAFMVILMALVPTEAPLRAGKKALNFFVGFLQSALELCNYGKRTFTNLKKWGDEPPSENWLLKLSAASVVLVLLALASFKLVQNYANEPPVVKPAEEIHENPAEFARRAGRH